MGWGRRAGLHGNCGELPSPSTLTHMARGVTTTQAQKMSHLFPERWSPPETEPEGRFQLRDYTPWQTETMPGGWWVSILLRG